MLKTVSILISAVILFTGAASVATPKTLLFCKNFEQGHLKSLTIQQNQSQRESEVVEVQEFLDDGDNITRTVSQKDLIEGDVSLRSEEGTRLVRRDGGWTVSGTEGDYKFSSNADCVE